MCHIFDNSYCPTIHKNNIVNFVLTTYIFTKVKIKFPVFARNLFIRLD